MDRFDNMRVFAKVVESASFTGAAARLGISASMVSQHVKELEERLGARLLNRTTRKVSLTEVGKAYYDRSMQILGGMGMTRDTVVERIFRDTRAFRIYDGPSEVHRWAPGTRIVAGKI